MWMKIRHVFVGAVVKGIVYESVTAIFIPHM